MSRRVGGATWSGTFYGRTLVALDPGGDLSNWQDLQWVDCSTGQSRGVTTGPDLNRSVILETPDERASLWSRAPRSEPIDEVVIDPDLVAYTGRVSGVIDADADGLEDPGRYRPTYEGARSLAAVQKVAQSLGYRAFARRTGLALSVAKRAATGRAISPRNVDRALRALGRDGTGVECALPGCDQVVTRGRASYCSKAHRDRAYRARKRGRPSIPDPSIESECPGCGATLYGEAVSRPCPICSSGSGPR
jgi:hypothetical protein